MPDTYRPLREDDPVGTEVYLRCAGQYEALGRLLATTAERWCWSRPPCGCPVTHEAHQLYVRVPDPWGELLRTAKKLVTDEPDWKIYDPLRAAIAAAEAHQAQAKEVTNG
jgi:hypothetical protein